MKVFIIVLAKQLFAACHNFRYEYDITKSSEPQIIPTQINWSFLS